jgi:hypothetical protein
MKRLVWSALLGLCAAVSARSDEPIPVPPTPLPKPEGAPAPDFIGLPRLTGGIIQGPCGCGEKTIWVPRLTLVPEETAIAVPKMKERLVEVGRDFITKIDLDYRTETHKITELVVKSRDCEQQVVVMTLKPETTIDPVTGHSCTVQKPCPEVKTVKTKVYYTEPEEREVTVRIPCLKQTQQEVAIKKFVIDEWSEAAIERRYHYILTPNEIHAQIPPCPYCAPTAVEPIIPHER